MAAGIRLVKIRTEINMCLVVWRLVGCDQRSGELGFLRYFNQTRPGVLPTLVAFPLTQSADFKSSAFDNEGHGIA